MSKPFVILSWIFGTGLVILGALYGGSKYIAWEQIKEDRAMKADTTILKELREIRVDIRSLRVDADNTKSNVFTLTGSYNALDHSYVRMLEKTVKDKDELSKYKDEKILELQNALKKN